MAKQREEADIKADEATIGLDPAGTEPQTTSLRGQPAEKVGGTIGPYKLLDELGAGGMGTVYLAEQDRPVRRRVALKIIKPGLDTAQVIARFEAERQALALMDHSNIARVLDAGTTASGRPYFVMELVQGVTITSYCDQHRLPLRERLDLFLPVCRAVQHAHQKGIIHRDLKPSNILVTLRDDQPVPKIIDFGIAKATTQRLTERTLYTQYGQLVGTPDYMSPEQAGMGGIDVDTRSDVYSLGAILYELLCGETPFGHQRLRQLDFVAMLNLIYEEEPPTLSRRIVELGDKAADIARRRDTEPTKLVHSLRGELDWIVTKALEKERTRRYESASALAADIQRYLNNEPVEASPPSATYRLQKFVRRNRAPLAAAAAIAFVLIGGIIVSGWQAYRATQAERDMAIERQAALDAKIRAEKLLTDVDEARKLAEAQKKLADVQRETAQNAKKLADERGTQLAAALQKESKTRAEIEVRLREADAMRLAMSSKDSRQRYPQRALLLAAEAVEATRSKKEPIRAEAHQALREAIDNIGGRPMVGHESNVNFAEVTPNGRWLFTSDWQTVRRWDLTADDPVQTSTHVGASGFNHRAIELSPNGRWLVTVSQISNSTKLNLWELQTDKLDQPVRQIDLPAKPGYGVSNVVFSADARWLAAWNWQTAWVWDLAAESASPVVLQAENSNFNTVAITPNGRWAVTLDGSRVPRLWSLTRQDSKPAPRQLVDAKSPIDNSQISSDGRWLVASDRSGSSDNWTRVWDLNAEDSFASRREVPLDRRRLYGNTVCHFLEGGHSLAVASGDTITLWDLLAEKWGAPRLTLFLREAAVGNVPDVGQHDYVQRLITDREARWLLAVDQNGSIRAWDLKAKDPNGSRIEVGRHGTGQGIDLTLSPSGRWLVSRAAGDAPRLWDLWRRNRQIAGVELRGHDTGSDSSIHVATGGGKLTALGGAREPIRLPFMGLDRRMRASLGLGERWLVTRDSDATPRLWDLSAEDPARAGVQAGTFKLDARDVAVRDDGNWVVRQRFSDIQVIDPDKLNRVVASVEIRPGNFSGSWSSADRSLSGNGRWLALRTGDRISVYNLASEEFLGGQLKAFGKERPESPVSRGGEQTVAEKKPAVWQPAVEGGRWLQQFLNPQFDSNRVVAPGAHHPHKVVERVPDTYFNQVVISPDGRWLLTQGNNNWRLWDLQGSDGTPVTIDFGGNPVHISFSPDGRWLVAYRRAGSAARMELSLWNLASNPLRSSSSQHDLAGSYSIGQNTLAFSGDGRFLASNTGGIRVWQIADDGTLGEPETLATQSNVGGRGIALSRDGRYVAAADNQAVHLWDRNAQNPGARQKELHGHEQSVERLAFSPDGAWLVSASHDGELRLWDLRDEQLQDTMIALSIHNYGAREYFGFQEFLFSPDGRWLAASTFNSVYFWRLDPASLLDEARRLAGRELSTDELARYRLNTPERQRDRLLRQAEQITKLLEKAPQDVALLRRRVDLFAGAGEFDAAIDDLRLIIRLQPDDHWPYYCLLTMLAQTNQPAEYRRVGETMAERFRDPPSANLEILERVAKGCMFWAESASDWTGVAQLGDRALEKAAENKHWVVPWAQIAQGMGEYRLGNYAAALKWADKGLGHPNSATTHSIAVPGNFVKAVAHAQLGQMEEAVAALAAAKKAQAAVPTPLQGWAGWNDWYMCDIMLREADTVLLAKSPPDTYVAVEPNINQTSKP